MSREKVGFSSVSWAAAASLISPYLPLISTAFITDMAPMAMAAATQTTERIFSFFFQRIKTAVPARIRTPAFSR